MKSLHFLAISCLLLHFQACAEKTDDAQAPPARYFADIINSGTLKVGIVKEDKQGIRRQAKSSSTSQLWPQKFSTDHGLKTKFFKYSNIDAAIDALTKDKIHILVAGVTITKQRQNSVDFSAAIQVSKDVLVGRRSEKTIKSLNEVQGSEIYIRSSSSSLDRMALPSKDGQPGLSIVDVPADESAADLLGSVADGSLRYAIVEQEVFDQYQNSNNNLKLLFTLPGERQSAWALNKKIEGLKTTIDKFITEQKLTQHRDKLYIGDLKEIRKRGSIRVLTRNNALSYFIYKGEEFGFDRDLLNMFAKENGLRLEIVVPPSRDLLIPWLLQGRGDIIAASMTITPERSEKVSFSRPYLYAQEYLIQNIRGKKVRTLDDLQGRKIHVRKSSSYYSTLLALQEKYGPFEIVIVDENIETERLLAQVSSGKIKLSVADSTIYEIEQHYHDNIEAALPLPMLDKNCHQDDTTCVHQQSLGFALRPNSPELLTKINAFVQKKYRGLEYNMAIKRYFKNDKRIKKTKAENTAITGTLSPYDAIVKKYAKLYDLDWRLLVSQMYQESRFDPKAKSWAGARGLFQLMPRTAGELGIRKVTDPEENIRGGIKYLRQLFDRTESTLEFRQRMRFALAAYNVGYGHLQDARKLATRLKLDPNRWFGNVEKAILLLKKPKYYKRAKYGYCRGTEPVKYVSEIQLRYEHYAKILAN